MSTFEIKMPKLGESITEGTIMRWAVKPGDIIKEDDVLFEVSTQKVSAEIPSPVAGKVLELRFAEGDTVPVGTVMAIIDLEGEASTGKPVEKPTATEPPKQPEAKATPPVKPEQKAQEAPAEKQSKSDTKRFYSPLVMSLAQEANIATDELNSIAGTGYEGRVSKADIERYIEQKKKGGATPSEKTTAQPAAAPTHTVTAAAPTVITVQGEDTVVEMDRVRRLIADHMVMSKKVSPHVTTVIEVDVTNLVRWREKVKDEFFKREGVKLTFMPAIVEASSKALIDFPKVNASVDGYNIILKKNINMGVAVALPNGNLIVPVVRNADKLNLNGLAASIETLAAKARNNKLMPDDIQGGTFTITNFGTFKNIIGTPIINQPQVAILGVGYIEKKPAVIETPDGDMIAIRHKMYLSLSYDHRIVDGALGGAFLKQIADYLENWDK